MGFSDEKTTDSLKLGQRQKIYFLINTIKYLLSVKE